MSTDTTVLAVEAIASRILALRGQRVIVDADLAALYGVPTKRLNEQVRRNAERLLADFMLALSQDEWDAIRSQFATLKTGRDRVQLVEEHYAARELSGQPEHVPHGLGESIRPRSLNGPSAHRNPVLEPARLNPPEPRTMHLM